MIKPFSRSHLTSLLAATLVALTLLAAPAVLPGGEVRADSLREVAERVARQNDARVVSARVIERNGRRFYEIRIMTRDGVVKTVRVPADDRNRRTGA